MADTHQTHHQAAASLCLLGAMDRLWFRHAVIFPEPIPLLCPKSPQLISDAASVPVQAQEAEIESMKNTEEEITPKQDANGNIPTRISQKKARSKSHSPKHERQQQSKSMIITKDSTMSSSKSLEKTTSSKTYEDLEQEEVKGFIDLGFRFKKEHISPRMMTVVPGLRKIIKTSPTPPKLVTKSEMECLDKNEAGVAISATMRPYLSEAWVIKRPDSPLLNMRVRRGYAAADMKKQLKSWAITVATETIQQSQWWSDCVIGQR